MVEKSYDFGGDEATSEKCEGKEGDTGDSISTITAVAVVVVARVVIVAIVVVVARVVIAAPCSHHEPTKYRHQLLHCAFAETHNGHKG